MTLEYTEAEKRKQYEEQFEKEHAYIRKERTAADIMRVISEEIIVWLPFLNRAVLRMPYSAQKKRKEAAEESGGNQLTDSNDRRLAGTNGNKVYADPDLIISLYRRDKKRLSRIFLHMIFHCLFCHPFRYDRLEVEKWDLAADIAVENVIDALEKEELYLEDDTKRRKFLLELKNRVSPLTADNLYQYYFRNPQNYQEDLAASGLFCFDTHGMWLAANEMFGKEIKAEDGEDDFSSGETEMKWKNISGIIRVESEVMKRYKDTLPGAAVDSIKAIHKEKQDYSEFLKKFIALKEEMHVNPDEYDYIYYTYGMALYKNMPLIEPLEYREASRIRDLVIAIDTSGSCQGKIVRSFLDKTYTIMKTAGAFFSNMNIHIIQCDSRIQSDEKITSMTEFDSYIRNLKVRGYGGTDFRPVFERIDRYLKNKEFRDLKGLLYFTDGLGTYPGIVPSYPVAFIIIEDEKEKPAVPSWAIKLITEPETFDRRK